ncbi:uncharacterized protein LOC143357310 isoform X2 [Halictus rubicundus]|uniref:uncharacterized protein LOC143357310 isoform X2 n=1 Tax=Halictus rubicundus TaxID=77578 RepID=UPI00403718ED
MEHDKPNYEVLNEDLNCLLTTSKVYLVDLKRWTKDYPNKKESERQSTMQLTRKLLEHSDLVMYMKENQRAANLLDAEDYHLANMLEFPEYKVVRRRRSKHDKHLSNKEKKKKKKRAHKDHPEQSKTQKKRTHDATGHAVAHKTHKLKKKENKSRDEKCYLRQHQSLCISILFVLLFIVLCLVAAYYLHRRSRLKARGTRFKYNWAANKEDKDTLTDYVEWKDEAVCSCSDVDTESAIKCPLCNRFYQTASDISNKYLRSLGVQKSKDKEKKKRFSFLPKSFQDKKKQKNLENRDWKCVKRKNIGTMTGRRF